jgi:hypothetical protein
LEPEKKIDDLGIGIGAVLTCRRFSMRFGNVSSKATPQPTVSELRRACLGKGAILD